MAIRTLSLSRRSAVVAIAGSTLVVHKSLRRGIAQDEPLAFDLEEGVPYGEADGTNLVVDIRRPSTAESPLPAVILIHGGGWTTQTSGPEAMLAPAELLAQAGYATFNISYRLTNDPVGVYQWPDQLDDVQRAVRWVRANAGTYSINPDRVAAAGYSAGGHLAACLAVRETRDDAIPELQGISSRVNAAVSVAGNLDLSIASPQDWVNDLVDLFIGGPVEDMPDAWIDASPVESVDADSSPMMLIHGERDDVVPVEASIRMAEALESAGVEVVLEMMPDQDHTSIEDWYTLNPLIVSWLDQVFAPGA